MQASATRDYLHSLNQNGHKLPVGPVIISPDGLFPSLFRCPSVCGLSLAEHHVYSTATPLVQWTHSMSALSVCM